MLFATILESIVKLVQILMAVFGVAILKPAMMQVMLLENVLFHTFVRKNSVKIKSPATRAISCQVAIGVLKFRHAEWSRLLLTASFPLVVILGVMNNTIAIHVKENLVALGVLILNDASIWPQTIASLPKDVVLELL